MRYAEANTGYVDGSDITCTEVGYYIFKRGWGDCMMGCIYADYWEFEVAGSQVELVAQYGDSFSGVDSPPGAAVTVELQQNAPNPFNPETSIRYSLEHDSFVQLCVLDARGRLVRRLLDEFVEAGDRSVSWDGRNDAGRQVASGVYYYRVAADGVTQARKMVLMK